jgi:hypothetical protein
MQSKAIVTNNLFLVSQAIDHNRKYQVSTPSLHFCAAASAFFCSAANIFQSANKSPQHCFQRPKEHSLNTSPEKETTHQLVASPA